MGNKPDKMPEMEWDTYNLVKGKEGVENAALAERLAKRWGILETPSLPESEPAPGTYGSGYGKQIARTGLGTQFNVNNTDPYRDVKEKLVAQIPITQKAYETIYEKTKIAVHGSEQKDKQTVTEMAEAYVNGLDEAKLDWVKKEMEQGAIVDLVARTQIPMPVNHPGLYTGNFNFTIQDYVSPVAGLLHEKLFRSSKYLWSRDHTAQVIVNVKDRVKVEDMVGKDRSGLSFMLVSRRVGKTPGDVDTQKAAAAESPAGIVSLSPMDHLEHLIKVAVETEEANADKSHDEMRAAVQNAICPPDTEIAVRNYQMDPVPVTYHYKNGQTDIVPTVLCTHIWNEADIRVSGDYYEGGIYIGHSRCDADRLPQINYCESAQRKNYYAMGISVGFQPYGPDSKEFEEVPQYFTNQYDAVR